MTEVLSERSSRVVSYAKLHRAAERRDQGRFVAEGANAVASALAVGRAEAVLVADEEQFRHRDRVETAAAAGVPVSVITGRAASKLAETSTPAGIFAICPLLVVPLDAEAFGKGYGEENDWCLRASKAGFVNLLAEDVYVYHAGQISFGLDEGGEYDQGQHDADVDAIAATAGATVLLSRWLPAWAAALIAAIVVGTFVGYGLRLGAAGAAGGDTRMLTMPAKH